MQKKMESRKMLSEQLEQIRLIENRKKLVKLNDKEEEKITKVIKKEPKNLHCIN